MSDTSQGPGWWMASDGRWYPPTATPGVTTQPSTGSNSLGAEVASGGAHEAWRRFRRLPLALQIGIWAFIGLCAIGGIGAATGSGKQNPRPISVSGQTPPTTASRPATTVKPRPSTTAAPTTQPTLPPTTVPPTTVPPTTAPPTTSAPAVTTPTVPAVTAAPITQPTPTVPPRRQLLPLEQQRNLLRAGRVLPELGPRRYRCGRRRQEHQMRRQ